MQEFLEEEADIAREQDAEPTKVSAKVFEIPIYQIALSKALLLNENDTLLSAVNLMQANKIGAVCIVNKKKELTGIITERDIILKGLAKNKNWQEIPVKNLMSPKPFSLHREDPLVLAMHNMHIGGYRNIPILDNDGKIESLITIQNVMKYLMDQFPVEIDNIIDEPFTGEHIREGA
jgi:CBS domain-containing protein